MIITYLGKSLVKVQYGDLVLAFNPYGGAGGKKAPKFGADIALVSARDEDFNNTEGVTFGTKAPFIVNGPGEYEVGGVYIKGVSTEEDGAVPKKDVILNTAYAVLLEDLTLFHFVMFS